jgi:hypothetical protein
MLRISRGRGSVSKEAVPDEPNDPMIEVLDDVKGKYKQTKLLYLYLMDTMFFPQINIDMFFKKDSRPIGKVQFIPKDDFLNLLHSMIMKLWDLPVFETNDKVA